MNDFVRRSVLSLALVVTVNSSASGRALPGTGYNLQARGIGTATYYPCIQWQMPSGQSVPCGPITKVIDFSVDPYALGPADPQFIAKFDARWGLPNPSATPPDPGAFRRKKWAFIDNERVGLARAVLTWACQRHPDMLGIVPGAWTCESTEREEMDFKAGGDITLVRAYFDEQEGAGPARPLIGSNPDKPCGDYSEPDVWWWGWTVYHRGVPPCASTPVATTPVVTEPPVVVTPPATCPPVAPCPPAAICPPIVQCPSCPATPVCPQVPVVGSAAWKAVLTRMQALGAAVRSGKGITAQFKALSAALSAYQAANSSSAAH